MLRLLLSALQDAQALLATGELRSISGAKQSRVLKQGHPASYPPFAVFYQKHIALVQQRCLAEGLGCGGKALAKMAGTMWSELSEAEKQPFVQEAARRRAENAAKLDAGEQARAGAGHDLLFHACTASDVVGCMWWNASMLVHACSCEAAACCCLHPDVLSTPNCVMCGLQHTRARLLMWRMPRLLQPAASWCAQCRRHCCGCCRCGRHCCDCCRPAFAAHQSIMLCRPLAPLPTSLLCCAAHQPTTSGYPALLFLRYVC